MARRSLVKSAGGAALAFTAASYNRVLGANSRIRVGVIGCGNRGRYLTEVFRKRSDVEIGALCDVFGEKLRMAGEGVPGAAQLDDHRRLVGRGDIDAVIVATPDHWHAPMAIDAMNAGKDVYVEKPLTFRREEGPRIVHAARVNARICQVGLQRRSATLFRRAKEEIVDSGQLGKVTFVRSVWHSGAPYDLGDPHQPQPPDLNWERFLGSVRKRPWNPHQYHHYRLFLDFGGGSMTDLLTHWIDVVHMLTGKTGPTSVAAVGGIFVAEDDRTAPDTVTVVLGYDGFTVTFESASLAGLPEDHIVFCGTKGNLLITRDHYKFQSNQPDAPPVVVKTPETFVEEHVANFLDCCRSRESPNCDAETGHRSALPCHLATMSFVMRKRIQFDPQREAVRL
ncbi:Gfo/Idh/MocA family oxidoreductase [uncultured Paludibaculum sp.]|uniref:Gfo/Idh/MocA family protein n=1 Tax=uncultured Paludibaculum sp. TaxID=1765020 RepID=UPI002AABE70B|nr:Gfo/Idh/MocA family oxidoreductase [uncultured Paludibaculum sp.]